MLDFISLRILIACASPAEGALLRQGAALVSVPVEVIETAAAAAVRRAAADVDVVLLDGDMPEAAEIAQAVRSVEHSPLLIVLNGSRVTADALRADGEVPKPADAAAARTVLESYVRLKVPSRALVVDDSPKMRDIVRRILAASRFPLEVSEAGEGAAALSQVGASRFDIVFVDYHMPGLDGVETLFEIKRRHPAVEVVLMTSSHDDTVAARARAAGAAHFLQKPFYPADIDSVLNRFYGRRAAGARAG